MSGSGTILLASMVDPVGCVGGLRRVGMVDREAELEAAPPTLRGYANKRDPVGQIFAHHGGSIPGLVLLSFDLFMPTYGRSGKSAIELPRVGPATCVCVTDFPMPCSNSCLPCLLMT